MRCSCLSLSNTPTSNSNRNARKAWTLVRSTLWCCPCGKGNWKVEKGQLGRFCKIHLIRSAQCSKVVGICDLRFLVRECAVLVVWCCGFRPCVSVVITSVQWRRPCPVTGGSLMRPLTSHCSRPDEEGRLFLSLYFDFQCVKSRRQRGSTIKQQLHIHKRITSAGTSVLWVATLGAHSRRNILLPVQHLTTFQPACVTR